MAASNDEVLKLLKEVRDLLIPISACFGEQYSKIRHRQEEEEFRRFQAFVNTSKRAAIYKLLLDPRHLTQVQIAAKADTTQPTVSRIVKGLLARGWIEEDSTGKAPYREMFPFRRMMEATNDEH